MKAFWLAMFILVFSTSIHAQYQLTGHIHNAEQEALPNAHIHLNDISEIASEYGNFKIKNLPENNYYLTITYVGYQPLDTIIKIDKNIHLDIILQSDNLLEEVIIEGSKITKSTFSTERVNQAYLQKEYTGSLAKSLEKLPGVNAMEIGAGSAKPIIRGFGLNRIVVAENGIKQEGQQWGADHGLEIDPMAVEEALIIKGVGAIAYGSDAIGGVLKVNNENTPNKEGLSGMLNLVGKTVNNTIGGAFQLNYKNNNWFYKVKASGTSYGDYHVPTKMINYLNYQIPIYNESLKNTAGKSTNLYGQIGYDSKKFKSTLSISNVYQKAGFFPGSHGIPSIERVLPDGDKRNIDLPFQRVNHLKFINNSTYYLENASVDLSLGYQENHHQEWSAFHTHYPNQQAPIKDPNVELDFLLKSYNLALVYNKTFNEQHKSKLGIQIQLKDNQISGYNFLLPEYKSSNLAFFATHEYRKSKATLISLGLRYDYNHIDIEKYYDNNLYQYLIQNGSTSQEANHYALRSSPLNKKYHSFNLMAGVKHEFSNFWEISANAGTNFRIPTAIELAANGIHHGSFRHEQGDNTLNPEKGWVTDLSLSYKHADFKASISPYAYYFSNYIFLKPTGEFSILPHAGQLFKYTESEALLSGVEISISKTFFNKLNVLAVAEYIHNQQLTEEKNKNFPLPFTPANNLYTEVSYKAWKSHKYLKNTRFSINARFNAKQNRIAQGEKITPSYGIFGAGFSTDISWRKFMATIHLKATNLFDDKYYNHTSFYRRLEIPEMGRNIQLSILIPFGK